MTYWEVEVYLHTFLTSELDGGLWSASRPGRFNRGVDSSAGLDAMAKRHHIIVRTRSWTLVVQPVV
jgi:hypothetical protein